MWSKRRVLLGIVFAVSIAMMTVSLLEMQERLLYRHVMLITKNKGKFSGEGSEELHKNFEKFKQVDNSDLGEMHKNEDDMHKLSDEQNVRSDHEDDNFDNRMGKEHEPAVRPSKVRHLESDFLEKSVNYDSKSDGGLKAEDYAVNFQEENGKRRKDKTADDKNLETFRNDVQSRDIEDDKEDPLWDLIHQAAKKIKKKKTDENKKLNVKEDIESIADFIEQHKVFDNYTFVLDTQHVRNCITGKILGTIPDEFDVGPFDIDLKSPKDRSTEDQESFREIYNERMWGTNWEGRYDNASASGRGANVHWTQEVIGSLHVIINQLKVILKKERISMLDVPCGDMNWMSRFLETRDDIDYTGVDIVPELIAKHKKTFRDTSYQFQAANILEVESVKEYDLIFDRMMLQHLYNSDVAKFLKFVSESGSKYLLTTTFPHHEANKELQINDENPGRFRKLNLEVPPFSLQPPICIQHDGPPRDFVPIHHFIALWRLPLHRVALCRDPWAMYLKGSKDLLYSCVQWGHRQP